MLSLLLIFRMMKEINETLLDKLLYMARMELSREDRKEMEEELNKMALWLKKLGEVDVEGVLPLASVTVECNRLREDVPEPPLPAEKVLINAPERSSHYFRTLTVKK